MTPPTPRRRPPQPVTRSATSVPRAPAPSPRRRAVFAALAATAIAALTAFVYRGALDHAFLDWDDATYVRENVLVLGRHFGALARAVVSHNFHPLTMFTLAWNVATPLSARPFLATNVALHAVNTFLVFWLVWRLSDRRLLVAGLSALLFGLHPMHVESVAWISERKDVLYAGFFLAGLIAYTNWVDRRSGRWLVIAFLAFVLACFSKGMAVSFPLVMVLIDVWKRRPVLEPRAVIEKLPFLAVALAFGLVAVHVQRGGDLHGLLRVTGAGGSVSGTSQHLTALQRLTLPAFGYMTYAWKLLVPAGLCALDPFPPAAEAGRLPFRLAPLFLLATLALAAWDARRTRIVTFGVGWYLATVVFVLQWLPVGQALMADRYTYLPYIGLTFTWGMGVQSLFERRRPLGAALWCASALFVLFLPGRTTAQIDTWQDDGTLWTRAIEVHPGSDQAYVWRGGFYLAKGRIADARRDFETAERLGNRSAPLYVGIGCVYGAAGKPDSARVMFDRALGIAPGSGRAYYNRGLALAMLGRREEALRDLDRALALSPGMAVRVLGTRGTLRAQMGDYRGAVADLDRVIAGGGAVPDALIARAMSRLQLGDSLGARADLRETLRLDPANANAGRRLQALDAKPGAGRP